ncbi:MAG: HEAT repeat domain-containing protein [Ignavibacteria bacterium]|nr:HEAT repeat domain-containing protein [Ignavibacteria bacterium]
MIQESGWFGVSAETLSLMAVFIFLLTAVMVLLIIALRVRLVFRERREKQFMATWRPRLTAAMFGGPIQEGQIPPSQEFEFLFLWNQMQESVTGESQSGLIAFAKAHRIEQVTRRLLEHGTIRERLIAVSTLGHLKCRDAWGSLRRLVGGDDPVLSLAAARAMTRIDASSAMIFLLPQISTRAEWPPNRVYAILKEAGPAVVSGPLASAAMQVERSAAPRMIRFLDLCYDEHAFPALRKIMGSTTDPDVLAACLDMLRSPHDLGQVRQLMDHAHWRVRMAAAEALGRLGMPHDVDLLVGQLSDQDWWVRRSAAHALVSLPCLNEETLVELCRTISSPQELALLERAMAEEKAA